MYYLSSILFVISGSSNWEEIYRNSKLVCCKGNYTFSEGRTDFLNNSKRISVSNEGMIYKADCTPENYGLYYENVGKSEKTLFLSGHEHGDCSKMHCIWIKYMTFNVSGGTLLDRPWLYNEIAGSGCSKESIIAKGKQMPPSSNHSNYLENQTRSTLNQSGSLLPNEPSCTGCIVVAIVGIASIILSGVLYIYRDSIKHRIWSHKATTTSKSDHGVIESNESDGLVTASEVTDGLDQGIPRTMSTAI